MTALPAWLLARGVRFRPRPPARIPGHGGGHFPIWVSLLIIVAILVIAALIARNRRR